MVSIEKSNTRFKLITTEGGTDQGERKIIQTVSSAGITGGERGDTSQEAKHPDMYGELEHPEYHWGMVIDLSRCTGCSACIAACNAENNIAVVGERELKTGREMNWIRLEKYTGIREGKFYMHYIPVMCQQCDSAPCEPVCPVYATHHNKEGLNLQIYNRCVGTRYCSNNCPYKARRFNWFTNKYPTPLNWQLNPDVTVREKGIMEKCTFCIQRIILTKDRAKDENRKINDGEILPACAQSCPAQAITFGNMNDEGAEVNRLMKETRAYHLLEELNTKPSVTYLKKIVNEIDL